MIIGTVILWKLPNESWKKKPQQTRNFALYPLRVKM